MDQSHNAETRLWVSRSKHHWHCQRLCMCNRYMKKGKTSLHWGLSKSSGQVTRSYNIIADRGSGIRGGENVQFFTHSTCALLTNGQTDEWANGRAKPLAESLVRDKEMKRDKNSHDFGNIVSIYNCKINWYFLLLQKDLSFSFPFEFSTPRNKKSFYKNSIFLSLFLSYHFLGLELPPRR